MPLRSLLLAFVMVVVTILVVPISVARAMRRRDRPVRSLWTGAPLPTLPVNAGAERLLGADTRTLVYATYFVTDAFDHDLTAWLRKPLVGKLVKVAVFLWASWRFDRFHFFCNQGLLPSFADRRVSRWELMLHRFLGKEVMFWTYGADVRTRRRTETLPRPHCCAACPEPGRFCICDDDDGAANQALIARYATAVFSMGDMTMYVPDSISDVFYWPVDLDADAGRKYAPAVPAAGSAAPMRVLHAPNSRAFKGSDHLLAAVERLRSEGLPVEVTLVERVPNDRALELYREADVIFDQCLIGFHGYVTQEAMALGKPVMCFIRDPAAFLLHPDECPIINTPPDSIERVLRELLADRGRLAELGRRGRDYVERHHTPGRFAERLRGVYERLGVTMS